MIARLSGLLIALSAVFGSAAGEPNDFVSTTADDPHPEAPAFSIRADIPLDCQIFRSYGLDDGLPSNWINDVLQTRDGFVWVATDNGLARFDGVAFQRFNTATSSGLAFDEIRALCEDRKDRLWIGTTKGLTCYRPGQPRVFEEVALLSGETVRAIIEDRTGTVWIGTENATFALAGDSTMFERIDAAPRNTRTVCEDSSGKLWFGTHEGLFVRQPDGAFSQTINEFLPATTSLTSGVPEARINRIIEDSDGSLWIATNRSLLHYRGGQFELCREVDSQQVYDVLRTRDGGMYVAARFGVFRCVDGKELEQVSDTVSAFALMEDREGGLWIGHGDNRGLRSFRNRFSRPIWTDAMVRCIHRDASTLWFGSSNGLQRIADGVVEHFGLAEGLPDTRVQTITPGRDGSLWIGTGRGFAKWSGTQIVGDVVPPEVSAMNIGTAFEDSRGTLWFSLANAGGYALFNGQLRELESLRERRIHWFWEDSEGVVWIGHETGLFQAANGQIRAVHDSAFEQLRSPRFLCHFESEDGTLWLGTSNGVIRHRSGRFVAFPPHCGIEADNIERLSSDGARLWFGGRDGLFHVPIEDLDAFAEGRRSRVVSRRIDGFNRFPPLGSFSQGCIVHDGSLWLSAEEGLVRLPIAAPTATFRAPTVLIEEVTVDGSSCPFAEDFSFLSGKRRLTFRFAVPAIAHPEHIQVRYWLQGHSDEWTIAGNQREATYTDLRPGHYEFRVAVRRGLGEWTEASSPIQFAIQARWWELTWIRLATVAAAASILIGYLTHRLRSTRDANRSLRHEIQERHRAEEKARSHQDQLSRVTRAASMGELTTSIAHEVKQPLFAIVSNAQTAKKLLEREDPDIEEVHDALQDIANDGNRASAIIDRIRALVKKQHYPTRSLNLNDVVRDATLLADRELRQRKLELQLDLSHDLPMISGDPIELQQVILNLLLNAAHAMKGAECRNLQLQTRTTEGAVQVAVRDHGAGVDDETLDRIFEPFFTTKPTGTGMGLAINRTIVAAHGGEIWAERNQDVGLTFVVSLPAQRSTLIDRRTRSAPDAIPSALDETRSGRVHVN